MRMKKVFCLLMFSAAPFCFTACNHPPASSSVSIHKDEPVVYHNSILGISIAFPPGWKIMMHGQYQANIMDITDPQMKSLFEAICQKSLFCAIHTSPSHEITIAAMGAKEEAMKPWDAFKADIKTAAADMKKHGVKITEMNPVEINQQKFIHVTNTQEIASKRYTFDTYYTQYPTFSLDYIAMSYSPGLVNVNTHIVQSFHNIQKTNT